MKKTLKKRLSACLAMLLVISTLLGSMPVTAAAKSGAMKVGSTFTSGQYKYKVTALKGKSGNVSLLGAKNKSITSVTIPNTVKSGKYKFKVTAIADKAFKGYKKLKVVNTNKNLKTIGSNAFNGCKKLEKVNIKGTNVTSVGKNALKGISKKAVIQVPEKKKSAYAGILKNKGQSSSVKVAAVGSAVTSAPQTEAQAAAPQTEVQAAAAQTETQAAVPQTEAKVAVPQKTTEQKATEQAPAQETPQTTEATEEETAKVETEAQTEAQVTEPQTEPETQASESESEAQPELTEVQTTEARTEATEAQTTEAQTEETKAQTTEVQTEVAEIQPAEKDKPQITEPETEPELKTQTEETAEATEEETTEAQTTKAVEEETTEAQTTKAAEEETTEAQTAKATEEEKTEAQTGVTEAQPAETDKQQVTEPETEPESQTAEPESEAQTEKETEAPAAPKAEIPQTYPQKKGLRYAAPPKADETDANVTETEETEPETKATESETEVIETETEVVETETETQATEHVHSYSDWQITKAATCTDAGEMTRTCDECGAVETDVIAVEGHSFGEWGLENIPGSNCYARNVRECTICGYVEKSFAPVHRTDVLENLPDIEPTCTTAGQSNRTKCPYCKQEFFGYVKPLGHEYSEEVTVEESTCVKPGISYRKCIRCDARTDEKEIAKATGHQWEEVSIAASCTEAGFEGRQCDLCGEKEGRVINPTGHKNVTTTEKATCEKDGFVEVSCSVCGEKTRTILPATGEHKWVAYPEVQATCLADGHSAYTQCSICGKYQGGEPKITKATGDHHWVADDSYGTTLMGEAALSTDPSKVLYCDKCKCHMLKPGTGLDANETMKTGVIYWIIFLTKGEWKQNVEDPSYNPNYCGKVLWNGEVYSSYVVAVRGADEDNGGDSASGTLRLLNGMANVLKSSTEGTIDHWEDAANNMLKEKSSNANGGYEFSKTDIYRTFVAVYPDASE